MASHLHDTIGKDLVDILKTHDVPASALKDLPDRLEIHLTEGLPKEVDNSNAERLLIRNRKTYSAVSNFVIDRNRKIVTSYDPYNQIIKIYPIH